MCGRFVISVPDLTDLVSQFGAVDLRATNWTPRWNVAPTQPAPVVTNEERRAVTQMQFGLVPPWAAKPGASMINARVETVATKGAFRKALASRRCVIPVSGYYEWKKVGDRKQPVFIHTPGKLIPLSGIWERWTSPDGEIVESFAILTRPAAGFVRDIHDRMPLEVPADALDLWLDPKPKTAEQLAPILQAEAGTEHLVAHPVSPLVNTVANDTPACIEPVAELPPAPQLELFAAENGLERGASPVRRRRGR
jgi:putative SOS response-associated peptidase YedK